MTVPGPVELYEIVETYAGFGDHHTGTEADERTTAWLSGWFEDFGADVSPAPFEFLRWRGSTVLRLDDGSLVPQLPVFYTTTGSLRSKAMEVVELPASAGTSPQAITDAVTRVAVDAADTAAVVLALDGPDDQPVAVNRKPQLDGGRPAVVIPGNWADRVRAGAELSFEASTETGRSANLVATHGPRDAPEVTVTTPLTGWTPCAGERGTGLAAALALFTDLVEDHRVRFVACAGHELDHEGLHQWLAHQVVEGARVIHLGASVGAVTAEGTLDPARLVATTAEGDRRREIKRLAVPANWTLLEGDHWLGEGATWRAHGAEVLSFLGSSRYFHTPADLPAAASNPAALDLATSCAREAARCFLSS